MNTSQMSHNSLNLMSYICDLINCTVDYPNKDKLWEILQQDDVDDRIKNGEYAEHYPALLIWYIEMENDDMFKFVCDKLATEKLPSDEQKYEYKHPMVAAEDL